MGAGGLWRPVGPEPAIVYWLRRAVLGALVLVLLAAGFLVVKPAKHQAASPSPSPTASARTSASPSSSPGVKACPDSALKITAATDSTSYSPGTDVQLQLRLQNVGSVSCRRDVGPGANTFTITSGGYATWASEDCQPPTGRSVKLLRPKQTVEVTYTWRRERSLHGCPTLSGSAKPGYYNLVVGNGNLLSNSASFSIS